MDNELLRFFDELRRFCKKKRVIPGACDKEQAARCLWDKFYCKDVIGQAFMSCYSPPHP